VSNGLGLGLPQRLPEMGRLRMGDRIIYDQALFDKTGGKKGARPNQLEHWFLTSQHESILRHVAEVYGGDVAPWEGAPAGPKQWGVYTKVKSLDVYIPTGALSAAWEMWSGGGCQRRCDSLWMDTGERCQCLTEIESELGAERFRQLSATDVLRERLTRARMNPPKACKPMTRLSVVLPQIPGLALWRVTTSSVNAGIEMPGTVDLLQGALANRQLIPAQLIIEQRSSVKDGKTTVYPVPVLSLHEVTAGELGRAGAFWVLGEGDHGPALDAPPVHRALQAAPETKRPTDGTSADGQVSAGDLVDRVNALRPQALIVECMRALRAKVNFPKVEPDKLAEAVAVVESYESRSLPPYDPPAGGGAGDRSPRPSPPSPREQSVAKPVPRAAEHVDARPVPQPPVSAVAGSQTDAEQARVATEALTASLSEFWHPTGGGPKLPAGITDEDLVGGASLDPHLTARVDHAWDSYPEVMQARLDHLSAKMGIGAK
jgi:hypothetical protein